MSKAIRIYQGQFGRVALLDIDGPLVEHAHHHCHVIIKASGADTHFFTVRGKAQPLSDETAILVNTWEPHAHEHYDPRAPRTVFLALYIEPRWLAEIQHPLAVGRQAPVFPQSCVRMSSGTRKLADALIEEMWWSDGSPGARLEELLFQLMVCLVRPADVRGLTAAVSASRRRQVFDPRIRRAIACLRNDPGGEHDMHALAARCGLSRARFFALFRRCTNVTPSVYVHELRMEAAIRHLAPGGNSLADIAYTIGFSAPCHFTRFFRQHLGITPGEYRRVVDVCDGREARAVRN